jgi:hypothetical protein
MKEQDMKRIQCKLRTSSAVQDWLSFFARIENEISAPSFRVNGKRRNGHGFYTTIQCDVEQEHIADVLTEYIAYLEKKPTISFEMAVQEVEVKGQDT